MNWLDGIYDSVRNFVLNARGVERTLLQLLNDNDIDKAMSFFENNDTEVEMAIKEYDPMQHKVMKRPNKRRKGKEDYITEKLPLAWQRYINEVSLFFLLGKPVKWWDNSDDPDDEAFQAFKDFLDYTRFNTTQRQAKRIAGAETECAKLYHIFQDENNQPQVKVVVLSRSEGYTLRPSFDQYKNMIAFAYGYFTKNGSGETVEHFDVHLPRYIFKYRKEKIGWSKEVYINPTGKINAIYYKQPVEWDGAQPRIDRDEYVDSRAADTNNYFADPMVKASADVIQSLVSPETVGGLVQCNDGGIFEYVEAPSSIELKQSEKKILNETILRDTFTPDMAFDKMTGLAKVSGEAIKRALIPGYIKRDNRKEIYEILLDREKNLILAIMMKVTHIHMRDKLAKLDIKFEFAEPFEEDEQERWKTIATLHEKGVISTETAIDQIAMADDPVEELRRIKVIG